MPHGLSDDWSTLGQLMAWCRQATSHYLSRCWSRWLLPYGVHSDLRYQIFCVEIISCLWTPIEWLRLRWDECWLFLKKLCFPYLTAGVCEEGSCHQGGKKHKSKTWYPWQPPLLPLPAAVMVTGWGASPPWGTVTWAGHILLLGLLRAWGWHVSLLLGAGRTWGTGIEGALKKGYFHSTMLMQSLRIGFFNVRQKSALGGRGFRFWLRWLRGFVRRFWATTWAMLGLPTPAAARAVFHPELRGLSATAAVALASSGPGESASPGAGGWRSGREAERCDAGGATTGLRPRGSGLGLRPPGLGLAGAARSWCDSATESERTLSMMLYSLGNTPGRGPLMLRPHGRLPAFWDLAPCCQGAGRYRHGPPTTLPRPAGRQALHDEVPRRRRPLDGAARWGRIWPLTWSPWSHVGGNQQPTKVAYNSEPVPGLRSRRSGWGRGQMPQVLGRAPAIHERPAGLTAGGLTSSHQGRQRPRRDDQYHSHHDTRSDAMENDTRQPQSFNWNDYPYFLNLGLAEYPNSTRWHGMRPMKSILRLHISHGSTQWRTAASPSPHP